METLFAVPSSYQWFASFGSLVLLTHGLHIDESRAPQLWHTHQSSPGRSSLGPSFSQTWCFTRKPYGSGRNPGYGSREKRRSE